MVQIVKASHTVEDYIDGSAILRKIERVARTCYQSQGKITENSGPEFVKKLLDMDHESVFEHEKVTVRFICSRAIAMELVRHRLASFAMESTRYCDSAKSGEIAVIEPSFRNKLENDPRWDVWYESVLTAESAYMRLRKLGSSPQEAREVLPNCLKAELVVTANLREWRHILSLRTSKKAHPQMRELMIPVLREFQKKIPILFDGICEE